MVVILEKLNQGQLDLAVDISPFIHVQLPSIQPLLDSKLAIRCSVHMDVQTTMSGLLWYWRKLKNIMILRQVLDVNEWLCSMSSKQIYGRLFATDIRDNAILW